MSSNQFSITGGITEPELRFTPAGKAVLNFSIADQSSRKNDRGEWENTSNTLWVKVALWGPDAEHGAEALNKGDQVTVTGRLINRRFQDRDGNNRDSLEVQFPTVARVVRAPRQQASGYNTPPQQQGYQAQSNTQQAAPQQQPWGGNNNYTPPPF